MKSFLSFLALTLLLVVSGLSPDLPGQTLDVDRLALLPSLTGTSPAAPIWSPDSRHLAFLWNDSGRPFRDLWVVDADGGNLRRLTTLSSVESKTGPALPSGSLEALQQEYAERSRRGISEAVWIGGGPALIFSYQGHLYRISANGGPASRLTTEAAGRSQLSVSPDTRYLSYIRTGDLFLWDFANSEPVRATRIGVAPLGNIPRASFYGPDVGFSSYRWSPDSRSIALNYEDRRQVRKMNFPDYLREETEMERLRRDVPGENDQQRKIMMYSVPAGRTQTIELPDPTFRRFGGYQFSPNGASLLIDQFSEDGENRWIYLVDSETSSFRELVHENLPAGGSTTSASDLWTSVWRTDGQGILYLSDREGWFRLYSLALSGGSPRPLTHGNWSIVGSAFEGAGLTVARERKEVFFIATRKSPYERQVYRLSESGGEVFEVSQIPGIHRPFLAPNGQHVASLRSADTSPTELYLIDVESKAERRITNSPPEEFHRYSWVSPRYVTFPSRSDAATLHARILEPPNLDRGKKYPVILGPVYSNTVRNRWTGSFDTFQQYLALEKGFVVVQVDIRGSVGYGREFRSQFVGNVGEIDIEDLHSGVDYLETLSYVDPKRIGIWGWSYGGLLTSMSLFKKPGVYQAGVAGAPATNVWHATTGEVDLFYHPQARPDLYQKGSAFRFAQNLADPLMIIHGMQDSIVLFRDSIKLIEKLMMLGKDFEIVILPNSVHSAQTRDYYTRHVLKKIAQHFERYLGSGPTPE